MGEESRERGDMFLRGLSWMNVTKMTYSARGRALFVACCGECVSSGLFVKAVLYHGGFVMWWSRGRCELLRGTQREEEAGNFIAMI